MRRLPKKMQLGFWYVKIVQISPAMMEDISTTSDACWSINLAEGGLLAGTIYVVSTLSMKEKWSGVYHELVHAMHDINYYFDKYGPPEKEKDNAEILL